MDVEEPAPGDAGNSGEIVRFWAAAQESAELGRMSVVTGRDAVTTVPPPAWAFGATRQQADELIGLVLADTKTATSSAHWGYEAEAEELPRPGELSIVLDGAGQPGALVRTTSVNVVPFSLVGEQHAHAEGEGDLSLAYWREVHERFFTAELAEAGRAFADDMLVVCEGLQLLYPCDTSTGHR